MKECKMFYLKSCPYYKKALSYLEQLLSEEKYSGIIIEKIEESENKALADSYDYYFVPCFYVGGEKVREGAVEKEDIVKILNKVIEEA